MLFKSFLSLAALASTAIASPVQELAPRQDADSKTDISRIIQQQD